MAIVITIPIVFRSPAMVRRRCTQRCNVKRTGSVEWSIPSFADRLLTRAGLERPLAHARGSEEDHRAAVPTSATQHWGRSSYQSRDREGADEQPQHPHGSYQTRDREGADEQPQHPHGSYQTRDREGADEWRLLSLYRSFSGRRRWSGAGARNGATSSAQGRSSGPYPRLPTAC